MDGRLLEVPLPRHFGVQRKVGDAQTLGTELFTLLSLVLLLFDCDSALIIPSCSNYSCPDPRAVSWNKSFSPQAAFGHGVLPQRQRS